MIFESNNPITPIEAEGAIAPASVSGGLPSALVLTQRAAAMLRAYLEENQLGHYGIFRCDDEDIFRAEWHLDALGETSAWETLGALIEGGEPIARISHNDETNATFLHEGGVLRLARHDVVLARWYWVAHGNYSPVSRALKLVAARSKDDITRLRDNVTRHRRGTHASHWQIVRGYSYDDEPCIPRGKPDTLLLADEVRHRIEADIVQFFSSEVAELYRTMAVPYRRGVLLHGPPGNGKTSLIRHIGARLPDVPAMLLRPAADFSSDDLEEVIRRWTRQAPAILVIEDLNWLLEKVNVSTFLNMLDGVDRAVKGGLLLIATTNHPDKLDPAVNNRPGRFDVVLRVPPPDRTLRIQFLSGALRPFAETVIVQVADRSAGMSFAHLEEIVRLSGLSAIHAGRGDRCERDLLDAVESLRVSFDQAERGFPVEPEQPFGLLPLRDRRKA